MSRLIMAMHQANYIPWLGYFYKIARADVFVYLDVVQYPRGQSFAARNRIKTPNGVTFLTIPVSLPKGRQGKALYNEVRFADERWKSKHLKTLQLSYKKAPFFTEVITIFEKAFEQCDNLLDLNVRLIEDFCQYLQIDTRRVLLSDLLDDFGQKTDLIIDLCQALGANVYLSGTGGGKEYNDEQKLNAHGIELMYSDFKHPVYQQLWGEFVPNLSIVDLLFNHGKKEGRKILLGQMS